MDLRQTLVDGDRISAYVIPVLLIALTTLALIRPFGQGHASPTDACPTVQTTQKYMFLYGQVTINATPAPPGSVVEARSPRGDTVGCQVVENAGEYPLMYVYGEETVAGTPIPGMRAGEPIAFAVNGAPATPNPVPTWANDWQSHQVDLSAPSAPPAHTARLGLSPSFGSYDVGDEFDVDVVLDAPDYLVLGIDVILNFDPGKLQVENFTGVALGNCSYIGRNIDNEAGTVAFSIITPLSGGEGCLIYDHPQDIVVGTIRFHARAGGVTDVTFDFTPGDKNDSNVGVEGVVEDMLGSVTNGSYGLCYDFNHNDEVDVGDLVIIAGVWRATDADTLADYNYNGNNKVDIGDIMTVAEHLGEPCP